MIYDQNLLPLIMILRLFGQKYILMATKFNVVFLYRHPYINLTIDQIHWENKLLTMGDFNIDLLKYNSHIGSENFINTLSSFFFQPQILQPTRITDHSSTLIDNIFFNSAEHFIIIGSGNLVYMICQITCQILLYLKNFLYSKFDEMRTTNQLGYYFYIRL